MNKKVSQASKGITLALAMLLCGAMQANAQNANPNYSRMAPLDQYLMADRSEEIALARSAAPDSISRDAEVLVLGRRGYETAAKGTNGFTCVVERSWATGIDDPEFWNPKLRAPICFNAPAVRSYLSLFIKRTNLILAGSSKEQMFAAIAAAFDKKELPALEPNAMCYMMSKQGYLNDRDGHWRPHVMVFTPLAKPAIWGAGLSGSPVLALEEAENHITIFLIPVSHWSDGSPAPADSH